ncbi:modifier of mdg4 isoform X2 [Drosophila virilis]|uniref:Mod(Mdg4), isoform D n=1 Tax=Drosophila virilis TaxID=7244 RepID=Q70BY8_DROVI|nr:modifier of mdg4 isoform X2 [Drosophila virilis]XP_032295034.1 modifier of mdg4 isoform X2 [Drosophila virilis]EDW58414.2 mod(mdg4), isoform D [Drosophila virilis]CAE53611.1 Mod(mdg4)-h60.1 [Drosophila virilis]
MADDEQFSLCWNNFNTNLSAGFHESLCRGDLVDVSLAAEGQIVKAHRLVLSVCSPFFRKMFTQMPSNTHAIVFLNNVSHSALKDLIQFMYCGEVNVKQDALPAFISTAESLQIKGLTDNDPAPQPPQEPTPPPAAPHVQQQQQQQVPAQRVQRQQPRASARYKIETVDDVLGDEKGTTQIVIQTTAAPQATIVQQQQQTQQQQQQHIQTQQLQTATTTTATLVSTNKRSAQRSSLVGSGAVKRSKTSTANVIDPLDSATETVAAAGTTTTQLAPPQQITVQTTVVAANEAKVRQQQQQQQQQQAVAQEEAEYIDLPMELPTKSEPDYSEEHAEVAGDGDTAYVEDDTYGDMRYDDSYFTENEDATGAQAPGNTSTTSVQAAATTSKAVVKQQSQSYSDSSFVDTGAEQSNTEAQANSQLLFIESPWSTPCLVLNGYMYNCHSRKNNKEYWRCHNYSKKVHEQRCRSRCVLENCKLKSITGGLHNHAPHTEKIEKIIQRNRLAGVSTAHKKLKRLHHISHYQPQQPKEEEAEEEEQQQQLLLQTEQQQEQPQSHHLLATDAATLQLTEHELVHASLMLIHD